MRSRNLFVDDPDVAGLHVELVGDRLLGQLACILADFLHQDGVLLRAQEAALLVLLREAAEDFRVRTVESDIVMVPCGFGFFFVVGLVRVDFHHRLDSGFGIARDLGTNCALDFVDRLESNHLDLFDLDFPQVTNHSIITRTTKI